MKEIIFILSFLSSIFFIILWYNLRKKEKEKEKEYENYFKLTDEELKTVKKNTY